MKTSISFYTNVLDFQCIEYRNDGDPFGSALVREGPCSLARALGGQHCTLEALWTKTSWISRATR